MVLNIETKFSIGDIVIAYQKGVGFRKFAVEDVVLQGYSAKVISQPIYVCRSLRNDEDTYEFTEKELFTESNLRWEVEKIINTPANQNEARRDIRMFSAIYAALNVTLLHVFLNYDTNCLECQKWLSDKFPEIAKCLKYTK